MMKFNYTSPYMFYGNELDADKHLLVDTSGRVMLVAQDKPILESIVQSIPHQFSIVTIDNTVNKIISNLNCLALTYSTTFKVNTQVDEYLLETQNKLLWLYRIMDDLSLFLNDMVAREKSIDEVSDEYLELLRKKEKYMSQYPDDKLTEYLFDVDCTLYYADYDSMLEFKKEAEMMFSKVDFTKSLDDIKTSMIQLLHITYIQNHTHMHQNIKDFFIESLSK